MKVVGNPNLQPMPPLDRNRVDPEIRKAAEGLEAIFVDYMAQVMRKTVPKNEMDLESPATQIYRGMLDTENSQKIAQGRGVGLADQIIAYLSGPRYTESNGTHPEKSESQVPQNSALYRRYK